MARSPFVHEAIWSLIPLHSPELLRSCGGCRRITPHRSTDKFRVNGNKRRLDVWLIYQCRLCGARWNATVHERISPRSLPADVHERLMRNDVDLAEAIAFDPSRHRAWRATVAERVAFRLEVSDVASERIRIATARPNVARLDRVLAHGLGLSRSAVAARVRRGTLVVNGGARGLRQLVRDGDLVWNRHLSAPDR